MQNRINKLLELQKEKDDFCSVRNKQQREIIEELRHEFLPEVCKKCTYQTYELWDGFDFWCRKRDIFLPDQMTENTCKYKW